MMFQLPSSFFDFQTKFKSLWIICAQSLKQNPFQKFLVFWVYKVYEGHLIKSDLKLAFAYTASVLKEKLKE